MNNTFLHGDRVMYSGFMIFTILVQQSRVSNLNTNKENNQKMCG